jgi:curved DNA-binding protein CbpA
MNEKRGIGKVVESAYLQLAAPKQEKSPWEVLEIYPGSPLIVAEAAYKAMAKKLHPDNGGSDEQMRELNSAIEKIRKGLS